MSEIRNAVATKMASRTREPGAQRRHQKPAVSKIRSYQGLSILSSTPSRALQLLVSLALKLRSLALGLALELGGLSLSHSGGLVGLALLGDFLCAMVLEEMLVVVGLGRGDYLPPFSMPLTAAPEIVLSTALAASLMVSTGLLRAMGVVENRRAWRAIWERNMVMCVVWLFD